MYPQVTIINLLLTYLLFVWKYRKNYFEQIVLNYFKLRNVTGANCRCRCTRLLIINIESTANVV